jgi:putative Holliday junction resolvase
MKAVGRVLALDLGRARVGVAIGDLDASLAHPRPPLDGSDERRLLHALASLCRDEGVCIIVLGLPLELDGRRGPAAAKALGFASKLADFTGLEVELVDERLSTVEASRRLSEAGRSARTQRRLIDGAAAAILLESWLARRAASQGTQDR